MPAGAAQFPRIILMLFAGFGAFILFQGFKKTKKLNEFGEKNETDLQEIDEQLNFKKLQMPMAAFLIVIAYVIIMGFLGFFVGTSLFVVGFMLFYKIRSWKTIVLCTAGINLFIYFLFVIQLNVPLPQGLLF